MAVDSKVGSGIKSGGGGVEFLEGEVEIDVADGEDGVGGGEIGVVRDPEIRECLGFLGVGALAQQWGAPTATLVCGVCGLLGVALTWLRMSRW